MEVSVRHPRHHYDVISYHCASKLTYFVEHDIGYHPSKFQCSRMSGLKFNGRGMETSPPKCFNEIKKPSANRVKGYFSLNDFYAWAACNGQNSKE